MLSKTEILGKKPNPLLPPHPPPPPHNFPSNLRFCLNTMQVFIFADLIMVGQLFFLNLISEKLLLTKKSNKNR